MKPEKAEHFQSPAEVFVPFERGASAIGKGMRTFQEEGLKFFNRRMQDNAKAARELAACKSLPDVLAAQQKWFADMTRAYSEEWVRYGEIMTGLLDEEGERPRGNGRNRSAHH